jgi:hypothetical protein
LDALENEALGGDVSNALGILQRVSKEYPYDIRYKELLPHIIEFLAHLENNNLADALDKVLDTGGAGLAEVKQALDQFTQDLERFKQKLEAKERLRK